MLNEFIIFFNFIFKFTSILEISFYISYLSSLYSFSYFNLFNNSDLKISSSDHLLGLSFISLTY
jgi:hypothetical protein